MSLRRGNCDGGSGGLVFGCGEQALCGAQSLLLTPNLVIGRLASCHIYGTVRLGAVRAGLVTGLTTAEAQTVEEESSHLVTNLAAL